ncbi:hypothetical protein [Stieleria neptunia]|nr:hypothetical protein [Stieleria neptunia]
MKKADIKRMFKAIEDDDQQTLDSLLNTNDDAIESHGFHNRLVRDKTPLMYALQCFNLKLAGHLLDRGANPSAVMPDGPRHSVIQMCIARAFCNKSTHDEWIAFTIRLLDAGIDPNEGLWPSLHGYGELVPRDDLIRIMLERGADPDRQVGNSGNTVRELVKINSRLYPSAILELFGVNADENPPAWPTKAEQRREPERQSRADCRWTLNRRRPLANSVPRFTD